MIVVSGCPRSGTSLMMAILRELLGADKTIGAKFTTAPPATSDPDETDDVKRAYQKYARKKIRARSQVRQERTKDMNPNGFWECPFTVKGLTYTPAADALLKGDHSTKVVKVVSQGLAQSDPQYVDKIIFMLRHPDNVAKSQEKLIRPGFNDFEGGDPELDGKKQKVFSYQMFNDVTVRVARWIVRFQPRLLLINYDELIEKPRKTVRDISEFVGPIAGAMSDAVAIVDPTLRRSVDIPEGVDIQGQELAYAIYDKIGVGDFAGVKGVVDEFRVARRKANVKAEQMFCTRLGRAVTQQECGMCRSDDNTRRNFKTTAEQRRIAWRNEPCAYDCLVDGRTIESSISSNHWI